MTESWKNGMQTILIFVSLPWWINWRIRLNVKQMLVYSLPSSRPSYVNHNSIDGLRWVTQIAQIVESYKKWMQDPNDVAVTLLSQISMQLAHPNNSIPSLSAGDVTFQPAVLHVSVNVFWVISLAFSMTAAFMAIMIIQWAGNYTRGIERTQSDASRALHRSFFFIVGLRSSDQI